MKWGVVRFPGSLDDADALWALNQVMGQEARALWHKDEDLADVQCVVLPGGFSYGDYLRCGAIARFAPIMKSVVRFAGDGGLVLGICNGFQILCEAHLLPGALMRNRSLAFICERVNLRVENAATPFTCAARQGEVLRLPIKHGEGLYVAPAGELRAMEERGQVLLRYTDAAGRERDDANPNGSTRAIAGVANETFNVFGLMPHPEHAVEAALGGEDGRKIFRSIIMSVERTSAAKPGATSGGTSAGTSSSSSV
jgi:phosphoribosylformylglycinamidine synthase subunit PurQ / glutaminase